MSQPPVQKHTTAKPHPSLPPLTAPVDPAAVFAETIDAAFPIPKGVRYGLAMLSSVIDMLRVAGLVVALDLSTKTWAQQSGWKVVLNQGVSFGWQLVGEHQILLVTVLITIILAVWAARGFRSPAVIGLFVGGGVANAVDRWLFEAVRDWLPVPMLGMYNNLADWAITVATVLIVWELLRPVVRTVQHADSI